jgi:hypothetical protein
MSTQTAVNHTRPSEHRYRILMTFWLMFAYGEEDIDQQELRKLHRVLCEFEQVLCEHMLDQCLENLMQRLRAARSLGMSLSIPEWAALQSEALADLGQNDVEAQS